MKKTIFCLVALLAVVLGACHDEKYLSMPGDTARFVSQYWPDPDVESVTKSADGSTVITLNGGPTLTFDSDYEWTAIDGNGLPLPQMLLFDQLPSKLYDYLESGSYLNQVFRIARTPREYSAELLNSSLVYDLGDDSITQTNG